MGKKTVNLGGGRQLRSHPVYVRRSPRFKPLTSSDATIRPLADAPSGGNQKNKSTKLQQKHPTLQSSEKKSIPCTDSTSQNLKRSPRLLSRDQAKSKSDSALNKGLGNKEISPNRMNPQTPRLVGTSQNLRRSSRLAVGTSQNLRRSSRLAVGTSQNLRRSSRLAVITGTRANMEVLDLGRGGIVEESAEMEVEMKKRREVEVCAKRKKVLDLGVEGNVEEAAEMEVEKKKVREIEVCGKKKKEIARGEPKHYCVAADWTKQQEIALRRAYLLARPSPHFWKKVSMMVQGKSAQECFNKIHADLATPPQQQPRSRAKKTNLSPVGTLAFIDKLVDDTDSRVKKTRSSKGKSAAAQKTVRHLLRKHQMADQTHEADCFSVLESSPNGSIIGLPQNGSPGTSDAFTTPGFLMKCSESSSSAHKKLLSRFKPTDAAPSPEVLKRIKNVALHERYIDHLHCREARRRAYPKRSTGANSMIENKLKSGILKDARTSLITEARKVIDQFQQKHANALDYADDDDNRSVTQDPNHESIILKESCITRDQTLSGAAAFITSVVAKDIGELQVKIKSLEEKLNEAEKTIGSLTLKNDSVIQDRHNLQQEIDVLRRKCTAKSHDGFPFLFVVFMALVGMALGYLFHS